jgi:molybdopterin-containing oxidoreductase family iron-sulfur binding subunit
MITLLGASMSIAGLAGCDIIRRPVENIVPHASAPEDIIPGIPRFYATTMPFRRCAWRDRREPRGTADQDRGKPLAPVHARASNSRIQASVLASTIPIDRKRSG